MSKATLATIPNDQDTDTLLEIALEQGADGKPLVALRRLSWSESLGWYPQQPLYLAPNEAESLLQSLRSTRHLWQTQQTRTSGSGKVVPFPTLLTQTTQQRSRKARVGHKK
jgi:hypothetical protein